MSLVFTKQRMEMHELDSADRLELMSNNFSTKASFFDGRTCKQSSIVNNTKKRVNNKLSGRKNYKSPTKTIYLNGEDEPAQSECTSASVVSTEKGVAKPRTTKKVTEKLKVVMTGKTSKFVKLVREKTGSSEAESDVTAETPD